MQMNSLPFFRRKKMGNELVDELVFSCLYMAFWGIILPLVITAIIKYYEAHKKAEAQQKDDDDSMLDELLPPDVRARTQAIREIYQIAHDPDLWSGKQPTILSPRLIQDILEVLQRADPPPPET